MGIKIKRLSRVPFNNTVYNIGVSGDKDIEHTYFADGILVHNCRSLVIPIFRDEGYDGEILTEVPASVVGNLHSFSCACGVKK